MKSHVVVIIEINYGKRRKNIIGERETDYTMGWREIVEVREKWAKNGEMNKWIELNAYSCVLMYKLPKGDSFNFHMKNENI